MSVCPKDTRPAVAVQRLRRRAIDQGIRDTPGSRRAKAYTHDVVRLGQVNKPMLPVVEQLDVEDMIAAAAYAASLEP